METHFEVIRQNVFSHARVMVIGVGSDLKHLQLRLLSFLLLVLCCCSHSMHALFFFLVQ